MGRSTVVLWTALCLSLICGTLADELVIEPEDAHFPYRGNLTVMCRLKDPLTRCQFRINHWHTSYPLMDFDKGVDSEVHSQTDDEGKLRYTGKYTGTSLKDGQCGLLLTDMFWGRYVVGCRARTAQGGWKQGLMTFRAGNPGKFNMTLTPTKAYVTPGSDVDVLCAADRPLKECSVVVQREDDYVRFHEGAQSESTPFYRYFGTGLENGQCGVTLLKVTEEDNGPVWCWGEQEGARGTARAAIITVISPPAQPELTLSSTNKYAAGSKISAVCSVKASRPVASITWLVGNEIVRKDAEDDVPSETWAWPWDEQIITQKLVLTLKKEHLGKDLACRVNHPALKQAAQVAKKIGEPSRLVASPGSSTPTRLGSSSSNSDLVITPAFAKFPYRGNLTVMCQSEVPITNCEFRVNNWRTNYPLMNFNNGPQSTPYTTKGSDRKLKFKGSYYGTGLQNGQCGLLLSDVYWGRYIVGCRVRGEKGGWRQATMTVTSGQAEPFSFTIDPGQAVVLPGSDVNVLCRADGALSSCYIDTQSQNKEIYFSEGAQSVAATIHYKYNGEGLQAGHCGVTLFKVSPVDNGPVWCWGEQNGERGTAMSSIITVASAPSSPELAFTSGNSYAEGTTLNAVCTARGSRPVASITWLVGSEVVRKDDVDDAPITEWKWPWDEQSITQKLTLKVKREYIGKDVVCQVEHLMLKEPIRSVKKILPGDANRVSAAITAESDMSLVIEPEDAHFPYRGNLTIMCSSNVPLKRCQFRINHWKINFPLLDFDKGARSAMGNATDEEGKLRYTAQYSGTGLENGQCGLLLTDMFWGRYVVGCRAQGEKGGWKQALMTFRSGNPAKFGMSLTPKHADVTPGSDVDVLCAADRPLKECSVVVQREDDYVRFHEGAQSESTPFYRYFGTGLENGQCGVTLLKVTEEDNGPVWCWGEQEGARGTARAAIITVINPPEAPELAVTSRQALTAGQTLTAICTVRGSRPVSTITWLLGNEIVRADSDDDLIPENWVWPWDRQAIIQSLSITLKPSQVGKVLTCRADHVALKQPLEASQKI